MWWKNAVHKAADVVQSFHQALRDHTDLHDIQLVFGEIDTNQER